MNQPHPQKASDTPCAAYRALFDDIAADESDAMTLARVESHAAGCATCRFALAAARAYRRAMRRMGDAVCASGSLRDRALGVLREVRGSRPT